MDKCVFRWCLTVSINLVCGLCLVCANSFASTGKSPASTTVLTSYFSLQESSLSGYDGADTGDDIDVVELRRFGSKGFEFAIYLRSGTDSVCSVFVGEGAVRCDEAILSEADRNATEDVLLPVRFFLATNFVYELENFEKWLRCRTDSNEESCSGDQTGESVCTNDNREKYVTALEFGVLVSDRQEGIWRGVLVSDFGVLVSDRRNSLIGEISKSRVDSCEAPIPVEWS